MKKSFWIKLCVVVMAVSMVLSMAACNPTTPEQTTGTTEETHEHTTESNKTQTTETETDGTDTTETDGTDTTETDGTDTTETDGTDTTETDGTDTTETDGTDATETDGTDVTDTDGTDTTETESKETEPKETESKETEPKETESKETEPKETESKETEPKETEPNETEPKETEPKETEPKETEPKETEPKETEPKETEPKETEPPVDCQHEAEDEYTWEYSDGEHWQVCVHCGEPFNRGAHDLSGEWQSNGLQHWKECPVCEEVFKKDDHAIGEEYKTDGTHHWKECEVCHEEIDKDTHLGLIVDNGDGTHSKQCNLCGEKYADAAEHVFGASTMGVTHKCECGATEPCTVGREFGYNDTHHWSLHECEACGMTTEEAEHIWAPGEDGISRRCEICKMVQTCEKGGKHFDKDDKYHWYKETCEVCGITEDELAKVPHVYDEYGHKSRTCTTCGHTEVCTKNHYEMDATSHKLIETCDICQITPDMLDNAEVETHDQKVVIEPTIDEDPVESGSEESGSEESGSEEESGTEEEPEENGLVIPAMKLVIEEGEGTVTYKHVCPTCSYVYASRTVSDDVNYYSAPGQVVNAYGTSDNLTNLEKTVKIHDTIISDEDGTYTRVYVFSAGIVALGNGTVKAPTAGTHAEGVKPQDELSGGLGKYIVFRIRTSGMKNVKVNIVKRVDGERVAIDGVGGAAGAYTIRVNDVPTDFTTFVIPITPDADATHIHALIGHDGVPEDGAYMDITYFAVCNDWDQIESVVGKGGMVKLLTTSNWRSAALTDKYSNGSCLEGECVSEIREGNIRPVEDNDDICYYYDEIRYQCNNPACQNYDKLVEEETGTETEEELLTNQAKEHDNEFEEGTHELETSPDGDDCYSYEATYTCKHCGHVQKKTETCGHKAGAPTLTEAGLEYACSEFGCERKITVAIPEGTNFFSAPGQVVNNWATSDTITEGGSPSLGGGKYKGHGDTRNTLSNLIIDEDGVYTRIHLYSAGSVFLTNGTGEVNKDNYKESDTDETAVDELTGGLGGYAVIKLRVHNNFNENNEGAIRIGLATKDANGNFKLVQTKGSGSARVTSDVKDTNGEFVTFVFNIPADADAKYVRVFLGISEESILGINAGAYVDVAYFAIVDNAAEAQAVIGAADISVSHLANWKNGPLTNMKTTETGLACVTCTPGTREGERVYNTGDAKVCYTTEMIAYKCSNPACENYTVEDTSVARVPASFGHDVALPTVEGNVLTYTCAEDCEHKNTTMTIPAGVNYFSAPGQVVNSWGTSDTESIGGASAAGASRPGWHAERREILSDIAFDENGVYTRIHLYHSGAVFLANGTVAPTGTADNDSANYRVKVDSAVDALTGGLGKYAVIRMRVVNNTPDSISLGLLVKHTDGTFTRLMADRGYRAGFTNTDGFVTYVIDLTKISNYETAAANAEYVRVFLAPKDGIAAVAGARIDLSYFALCDDWDEVEAVVGEGEKVIYTTDWATETSHTEKYSNGACVTCTPGTREVYKSAGEGEVCYYYDIVGYKCTNPDCPNYNVVDESVAKQENLAKEHDKVTTPGTPNYNHGLGADVCYTTTATVTCSRDNCQYSDSTTTQTGHDHSDLTVSGTTYSYACKHEGCQKAPITFTISEDVNYFSAPGQFVNHWMTSSEPDALTNFVNNEKTLLPHVSVDADGTVYTRVYSKEAYSRVYMSNGTADPSEYRGGTDTSPKVVDDIYGGVGKYVVVKLRLSDNADGNVRLEILTDTMTTAMFDQFRWVNKDGAWHILVVELPDTVVDKNASKINVKIREPKGGVISYIDIAYFGICDNWAEVESIVGEGKSVSHMTEWSNNATVTTKMSDGGCVGGCTQRVVEGERDYTVNSTSVCYTATTTTYKCNKAECPNYNVVVGEPKVENGKHALVEDTENGGWKCSDTNCNRHFDTTTAPTGVNYYAGPEYIISNWAPTTTPGGSNIAQGQRVVNLMADENGLFNRVYMNDGASFMLGNAALSSSYTENGAQWTLNGGSGRYAVIKIRANGVKAIRFGIKTDKGEVVAGGWANNWRTNADEFTDGEFTTYVIDLGEANVKSDATVVGIMMGTGRSAIGTYAAGGSLDIAYVALCDNWSEVASVVGTDDVLLTTWGNGTDGLGNGSSTDTPMTNDEVQAKIAE